MGECNSFRALNIYPNLKDRQFRLKKISKVRDYFIADIMKKKLMSKRLSKYIDSFDYFGKSFIVLSITIDSVSIASFIGAPVGIASTSFSLDFQCLQAL